MDLVVHLPPHSEGRLHSEKEEVGQRLKNENHPYQLALMGVSQYCRYFPSATQNPLLHYRRPKVRLESALSGVAVLLLLLTCYC